MMRERKPKYNQGDLIRFQRTVGIGPFTPHVCVIIKVVEPYYQIKSANDPHWKIWDIKDLDSDPNFTLLARA